MPSVPYCSNVVIFSGLTADVTYPMRSIYIDTTANEVKVFLPSTPVIGERHWLKDYQFTFNTNWFFVNGNGTSVEDVSGVISPQATFKDDGAAVTYQFGRDLVWRIMNYYA